MPEAPDLRVPKRRIVVELCAPGRDPRRAALFVDQLHAGGARRQDVLDLLEHEQRFLPVQELEDQIFAFVNKDRLQWVALPVDEELDLLDAPEDEPPLYDLRCDVRVELEQGATLDGKVLYSAPAEHARLSDFLNQRGRFFRLYTERRLLLVNRAFVVRVVECKRPELVPAPGPPAPFAERR